MQFRVLVCNTVAIASLVIAAPVWAGGTIKIDEVKSVTAGAGLRSGMSFVENSAPSGEDYSKNISMGSIRLYFGGTLHENISLEFNTEMSDCQGESCVRVLDAVAKVQISEAFNLWVGRFLPPSDRSNLSGPYFGNQWSFPMVQMYPAIFAGRDDGLAVWGKLADGRLKYQVGTFKGARGPSNDRDLPLTSARLTLNLWDIEGGYYNNSTYYGEQDTLAIGLVGMYQPDALGSSGARGDYLGWNVDFLLEKKIPAGVPTLEAAFYNYDARGIAEDKTEIFEGMGYFVTGSWLLNGTQGPGTLQPKIRYQELLPSSDALEGTTRIDGGVDYVITGHNARISFSVSQTSSGDAPAVNAVDLGLQVQL